MRGKNIGIVSLTRNFYPLFKVKKKVDFPEVLKIYRAIDLHIAISSCPKLSEQLRINVLPVLSCFDSEFHDGRDVMRYAIMDLPRRRSNSEHPRSP